MWNYDDGGIHQSVSTLPLRAVNGTDGDIVDGQERKLRDWWSGIRSKERRTFGVRANKFASSGERLACPARRNIRKTDSQTLFFFRPWRNIRNTDSRMFLFFRPWLALAKFSARWKEIIAHALFIYIVLSSFEFYPVCKHCGESSPSSSQVGTLPMAISHP